MQLTICKKSLKKLSFSLSLQLKEEHTRALDMQYFFSALKDSITRVPNQCRNFSKKSFPHFTSLKSLMVTRTLALPEMSRRLSCESMRLRTELACRRLQPRSRTWKLVTSSGRARGEGQRGSGSGNWSWYLKEYMVSRTIRSQNKRCFICRRE